MRRATITAVPFHVLDRAVEEAKGIRRRLDDFIQHRRIKARTYTELASLTDRELADIGFSRWDIRLVAEEHARMAMRHGR